jgi:hypothetical protein
MTNFIIITIGRTVGMGCMANEMLQHIWHVITETSKLTGYPLELLTNYQIPSIPCSDSHWFDN